MKRETARLAGGRGIAEVVPLRVAASTPTPARDDLAGRKADAAALLREPAQVHPRLREVAGDYARRKADAAALLRELAGNYGPRRAHKLRAMADFLDGAERTTNVVRS